MTEGQNSTYERIYQIVSQIPQGKVASYGQIARMVGGCTPRMVGYAMHALPEGSKIPWHRVINSQGKISKRSTGFGGEIQKELLIEEGVRFNESEKIDFREFGWVNL